jgi:hypothetical protein
MLPPESFAAPLVLAAGLAFDAQARRDAAELLGPADPGLLGPAGHEGLRNPAIARVARDLYAIAMHGSARLGEAVVTGADLDAARDFAARYLERDRSPADDLEMPVAALAGSPECRGRTARRSVRLKRPPHFVRPASRSDTGRSSPSTRSPWRSLRGSVSH